MTNTKEILGQEDSKIMSAIDELKIEVQIRREEDDRVHRQRQEVNMRLLELIREMKTLIIKRRERRSQFMEMLKRERDQTMDIVNATFSSLQARIAQRISASSGRPKPDDEIPEMDKDGEEKVVDSEADKKSV